MNTYPKETRKHWGEFKVFILKEYYRINLFHLMDLYPWPNTVVIHPSLHIFLFISSDDITFFVTHIPVWYAHIIIVHFTVNYLISLAVIHDVIICNLMAKMCLILPSVTFNRVLALFGKAYKKSTDHIIVRGISMILFGLCIAILKSIDE